MKLDWEMRPGYTNYANKGYNYGEVTDDIVFIHRKKWFRRLGKRQVRISK